jgi:hypothetical protein
LFNSHKYFCVNYFVEGEHMEIEERNLFTATELSTLLPLHGARYYDRFFQCNSWVHDILPHAQKKVLPGNDSTGFLKRAFERVLGSGLGNWLESSFLKLTRSRWKKRYSEKLAGPDFEIAFKSTQYISKNHPENYQRKIMDRYQAKLEEFSLFPNVKDTHD